MTLRLVAPVPDVSHNFRQAVFFTRETGAEKAFSAVRVVRLRHPFHQPHRVNQVRADNRRIQAFIIQNQHRIVKPWPGVHHIPAGAGLWRYVPEVGGNVPCPVHAGEIEVAKGRYRAAVPVGREAVYRRALQQEWHDLGFVENLRNQLAIFQVIGGERRFIFVKASVNLIHSVPGVVNGFALAKQRLCYGFKRE